MRARRGTRLGGAPPRNRRPRVRGRRGERTDRSSGFLVVLGVGLFIIGVVAGFGWMMNRQVEGGVLEQRTEAAQRPDWVSLRDLPAYVPRAFLTVVGPRAPDGQGRVTAGGGNPLASDLVRQLYRLPEGVGAEARRLTMTPLLDNRLSDEALLELYLNRIYLGQENEYAVYGIYHAARQYFGKAPEELTLSEAATLAGLLLPPRIVDPESRPGAVGARRNEVLRELLQGGEISAEAYRAAIGEPLGFQPGVEIEPMTRPEGWAEEPPVIRLPPNLLLQPDSATAG